MTTRTFRAGLSLVEVLIALGLSSVAMAAIVHSTGAILAARRSAGTNEHAAAIAETTLEDLLARDPLDLSARDARDDLTDGGEAFTRHTVVEAGPTDDLWSVRVEVESARGSTRAELRTLVLRPFGDPE